MKQIIPFVKDLELATRISEVTSIALEHNLQMENNDSIVGNFVVSGKYKINDISINEEVFEKVVPFDITLDDKYDATKLKIDIDDFYYEIINDQYLRVHIDVLADNLVYVKKEENEIKEEVSYDDVSSVTSETIRGDDYNQTKMGDEPNMINNENPNLENVDVNCEEKNEKTSEDISLKSIDITNNLTSKFFDTEEKYVTYKVHIVRESETIDQIKEKYNISTEELEKYNNLDNIILGTKLIIPVINE